MTVENYIEHRKKYRTQENTYAEGIKEMCERKREGNRKSKAERNQ